MGGKLDEHRQREIEEHAAINARIDASDSRQENRTNDLRRLIWQVGLSIGGSVIAGLVLQGLLR